MSYLNQLAIEARTGYVLTREFTKDIQGGGDIVRSLPSPPTKNNNNKQKTSIFEITKMVFSILA